ncbi:hypothetical protein RHS01_06959 [Rhizoctonia solani]|uniref:Uncharacterized protein n=1 Tax=Rhizoctonia solani TaxID=456999 RepID=A0A8H7IAR4_9AGAM|nr:hypothetical protein RHS01_06959 [Rhizoctonia solani]
MAQTGSPNTTPSPQQTEMLDAEEQAQRQKAIDTFLARTEFSKLARVLRARLSYASYKATHNVAHVPLTSLEHQLASRPTTEAGVSPSRNKLNHTSNMPPPPAQDTNTNGNNRIWRSAGMSLYQAVLDPGPAPGARDHTPTERTEWALLAEWPLPSQTHVSDSPSPGGPCAMLPVADTRTLSPPSARTSTLLPLLPLSCEQEQPPQPPPFPAPRALHPSRVQTRPPAPPARRRPGCRTYALPRHVPQPCSPRSHSSCTAIPQCSPRSPSPRSRPLPSASDPVQLPTPEPSQQTHSTPPVSPQPTAPFNLGDYINVSPSPAALPPRTGSIIPLQGRRLFDDDSTIDRSRGVTH